MCFWSVSYPFPWTEIFGSLHTQKQIHVGNRAAASADAIHNNKVSFARGFIATAPPYSSVTKSTKSIESVQEYNVTLRVLIPACELSMSHKKQQAGQLGKAAQRRECRR
ncbi:hypothetical protein IV203_025280 [Nitzschia inconspicua]|uniref:Uncharacterized protein n=1 Tax=Nitzschia inconspicua TaxID=303405 RepID=A0A9K3KAT2_9STRA|nr:hypothetical protein IV203_024715 [Nitzschia inconspicua]KAG7362396.1 hypothetical protein IV203_025280 [Nitzschia inconspicua]